MIPSSWCSLHMHQARAPNPAPNEGESVNAYLVELPEGVVCIDAMLTDTDSRALRGKIDELGKPLLALLLTHGHTDHYGGTGNVVAGDMVPVIASAGTDHVIRENDAKKHEFMVPLYGDEWPKNRILPTQTVADGGEIVLSETVFRFHDLGPGESGSDGYWTCSGIPGAVFSGDLVYNGYHAFLGDGYTAQWLRSLTKLENHFSDARVICPGHGGLIFDPLAVIAAQRGYIEYLRETVTALARGAPELTSKQKTEVKRRVLDRFGMAGRLEFFLDVSLDPVAAELAGVHRPA